MMVLDNLKSLGYDVEVKEDNIKLSYRGEGKPDKEKLVPLIEELKANKGEAIKELQKGEEPVSDEILDNLYRQTMHEINDQYIEGTIRFIEKNYPELDAKIDEVDKQINVIWESCLHGKVDLNDFKAELASYKSLYMQGIELFREYLTAKSSNRKDGNETLCSRCGKPGERFCYGEYKSGEYKFGDFCLECRLFNLNIKCPAAGRVS